MSTIQLGEAMPQIKAGKVAPLLVFSEERNSFLPDVPTAKESGYDVPVAQYRAVAAPKGTPEDVKDKLLAAIQETFKSDSYKEFNKQNMLTPKEISGEEVVTEWNELRRQVQVAGGEVRHQPQRNEVIPVPPSAIAVRAGTREAAMRALRRDAPGSVLIDDWRT